MTFETILQHWVLTDFVYPFLLAFFIIFAILEKTKLLGADKKQLNAMVAFVIGLIFVSAVYPKIVVGSLILFLTVSIVVVFVFLLLWGFVWGEEVKFNKEPFKYAAGGFMFLAVAIALLSILGLWGSIYSFLADKLTKEFWTNAIFILVIVWALAAVVKTTKGGKSE